MYNNSPLHSPVLRRRRGMGSPRTVRSVARRERKEARKVAYVVDAAAMVIQVFWDSNLSVVNSKFSELTTGI